MVFGDNKNNQKNVFNPTSVLRNVSDIADDEVKNSVLLLGKSGSGKSVSITGGKFKKLDTRGNFVEVEIPSFPLPMVVLDIDNGALKNIKTLDKEKQLLYNYYVPTNVDQVFSMLEYIVLHNEQCLTGENGLSIDDVFQTTFIDGVHHVWSALKGNMSLVKAKQNNVNLVKAMSSGNLNSMDKVTPVGTEYVPASTVWNKFTELLRKVKVHSNVVCTAGVKINDWGKDVITEFLGHKNQESDYDIWGLSEVEEFYIQNVGYAKSYYFTATRVRGGISGVKVEDFCYDKLQELI